MRYTVRITFPTTETVNFYCIFEQTFSNMIFAERLYGQLKENLEHGVLTLEEHDPTERSESGAEVVTELAQYIAPATYEDFPKVLDNLRDVGCIITRA